MEKKIKKYLVHYLMTLKSDEFKHKHKASRVYSDTESWSVMTKKVEESHIADLPLYDITVVSYHEID